MESEKIEVRGGKANSLQAVIENELNEVTNGGIGWENKLYAVGTFDLAMFDEEGRKVKEFNSLTDVSIESLNEDKGLLKITPGEFNLLFMQSVWHKTVEPRTPYEKESGGNKSKEKYAVNFKNKNDNKYKLVLTGCLHGPNRSPGIIEKYIVNIPNAKIVNKFELFTSSDSVSSVPFYFVFEPYNENGDMFEIIITR
jgi:hypothetical protein